MAQSVPPDRGSERATRPWLRACHPTVAQSVPPDRGSERATRPGIAAGWTGVLKSWGRVSHEWNNDLADCRGVAGGVRRRGGRGNPAGLSEQFLPRARRQGRSAPGRQPRRVPLARDRTGEPYLASIHTDRRVHAQSVPPPRAGRHVPSRLDHRLARQGFRLRQLQGPSSLEPSVLGDREREGCGGEKHLRTETFYNAAKQRWLVFWSTTVSDELSKPNADFDHRLYCATTTDFKTFSPTRLFCDPGFNCIDGTMLAAGGKFLLVLKDERRGRKNLHICTAPAPDGPWGPPSKPLPKPGRMVEGPSGLKVGDGYLIYFDVYSDDKYGAVCSRDLRTWQDVTAKVDFPPGIRHATMIEVAPSVLARRSAECNNVNCTRRVRKSTAVWPTSVWHSVGHGGTL